MNRQEEFVLRTIEERDIRFVPGRKMRAVDPARRVAIYDDDSEIAFDLLLAVPLQRAPAPVRLVLAFDGDRSRFSARDAALSELALVLTGEPLPYATLMYVWCNKRAPGTVIPSPRTDRIRKLVLESGPARLDQWLDYERDIRADYERVFGEQPGALVGIALMTDSDNTHSRATAWYGPIRFLPTAAR